MKILAVFFAGEFLAGKRFAVALSEWASGNRFLSPPQKAVPAECRWLLGGAKRLFPLARSPTTCW